MSGTYKDIRDLQYPFGYAETVPAEQVDALDNTFHSYEKAIVKDVISNPLKWFSIKDKDGKTNKEKYSNVFGRPTEENNNTNREIKNNELIDVIPANAILCYVPEGKGNNSMSGRTIIAFPFFPPHISLPLKPGEHVWLLKETTSRLSLGYSFYYWMSRITSYRQVDDINYTFLPQHSEVHLGIKNQKKQGLENISIEDKISITSYIENDERKELPTKITNSTIIASAHAYREEFTMEPVPRKFKNCGDTLIQGSNNSHLHLTTEKFNKDYLDDVGRQNLFTNPDISNNFGNFNNPAAGALDLVVGRCKKRVNELIDMSSSKIKDISAAEDFGAVLGKRENGFQSVEGYTLDKINETLKEDNDVPRNAFSRIYMTMNGNVDRDFEIKEESNFPQKTGPSIVSYSDHIRLFSEKTVRIANVNNVSENNIFSMIAIDEQGEITLQAGNDANGAKIILRPNGNIILKPGPNGLLHLGGDESDTTLSVCGVPTSIDAENGTATPEPIKSSLGGELFRSGDPDFESTVDIRATINAVAAAAGPSLNVITPGSSFPTAQGIGNIPGAPSADGTASSKVVIKA